MVWVTPTDISKTTRLKNSQRRITREGLKSCSTELVPSGSIVVTSRAPVGNVAITETELCTNQGCKGLVVNDEFIKPVFGFHVLSTLKNELQSLATGTTFTEISTNRLGTVPMSIPPLSEQAAIVRYLDYMDRRIRKYIRVKQKLIKLLEEQKQAIIHRTVTRGLDPNVRLKPSGVEWLGDVPEHWEVKRLKWVTRLQRGYDLPADQRVPGPFPVVSSGGVIDSHADFKCTGPGVVMGRYGSTEAVFYVTHDFWPHNTSLFVTHYYGNIPKWCYYLLRSITKADQSGKSAVPGIDRKDLFQIILAVPPLSEQLKIVRSIESEEEDLNNAISVATREIALLREYRTHLIADVVTGKLDVREAAANLPEEADEPEPPEKMEESTENGPDESVEEVPDDE